MDLKKILKWPALPSLLLFLMFVILNCIISEGFANPSAWLGFLQTVSPLTIIAIGEAVVILGGGIDISLGATVSLVNVIMATASSFGGSPVKPILLAIVAGILVGSLNGFLVSVLRISPLLVTFAVSYIASGLALTILPIPGGGVPTVMNDFFYYNIFGFIPMVLIFILFTYFLWHIWNKSKYGVQLYALGNNVNKAFFSGIDVTKIKFMTYVFAGLTASIAGIALSSNIGAGDARVGSAMTLSSVAACVVGGLSLAGGAGSVFGSIFGALFLNLVLVTVMGLGVPAYFQDLVSGLIVLFGIFAAVILSKKRKASASLTQVKESVKS
jgi:Ribose/xylose/arabinose/galactoside ABC-type transport systems, permease components